MAQKSSGKQQGARKKLKRNHREKTTVNNKIQNFEEGETVTVKVDPSVQEGRPHMRFHGVNGKITGTQGKSYKVSIKDKNKEKTLILPPAHLQKTQ